MMSVFFILVSYLRTMLFPFPIYLTMILGGIATFLGVKYLGEEIRGSGISHYIAARHGHKEFTIKGGVTKFVTSSVVLGSGCIAGAEGPAMYVGGTIATYMSKNRLKTKESASAIITLGGAAATAALFQAPLGSTIFAAEIPYRHDMDAPAYTPSFLSAIIGFFTFRYITRFILGETPRLVVLHLEEYSETLEGLLFAVIVGLAAGLVGLVFVNVFWFCREFSEQYIEKSVSPIVGTVLTGIVVFFIFFMLPEEPPFDWTGFNLLNILDQQPEFSIVVFSLLIIATILGTSLTIGFGVSGGVFAPALVVGGGVGGIIGLLLDPMNVSSYIVLGMSASHTATTKTPIASLVLVIEITGFPTTFLAPIAIANVVAYFVSGDRSLYTGQYEDRTEVFLEEIGEHELLDHYTVRDIMTRNIFFVKSSNPIAVAKQLIIETGKHTIPVIDSEGKVIGIVTPESLQNAPDDAIVTDFLASPFHTIDSSITLRALLDFFLKIEEERVIVVDNEKRLLGIVTLRDVIRTTRKAVVLA